MRVLITGALGQLGVGLTRQLKRALPAESVVIPTDIRPLPACPPPHFENYRHLDVLDRPSLQNIVQKECIDCIVHLSALLSYKAELNPAVALDVNLNGVHNVLECAQQRKNVSVFCPSTIGVYGFHDGSDLARNVHDFVHQRPSTIYGITKVHMELMGSYYRNSRSVDFRSVRLPGIISAPASGSSVGGVGGGTTDYSVDMLNMAFGAEHQSSDIKKFTCPLEENAELPMMWVDDCLNAIYELMVTDKVRHEKDCIYNITGCSFTPKQLEQAINTYVRQKNRGRKINCIYGDDYVRNSIAKSWPKSLDDSRARSAWNWNPKIDSVDSMVKAYVNAIRVT